MDELMNLAAFLSGRAFASSLVCSIEGDAVPDGGAPALQTPPTPATSAAPTFTPEQLAWITERETAARNAGAAAARRAEQGRQPARSGEPQVTQPPPTNTNTPAPQAPHADAARTEYFRLRAFDRAVDVFGLSAAARAVLEDDFQTANPPDPAAWVTTRATAFGWRAPTTQPNGNGNVAPLAVPPQPTPGSAPPSTVVTEDTRIADMSVSDREALASRIGPHKFRSRLLAEMRADPRRFALRR